MSYLHPDIDVQHIINSATNSQSLSALRSIQDRLETKARIARMSPQQYANWLQKLEEGRKNTHLTPVDEVTLKIGSLLKHYKDGTKALEKYNSIWTQAKLKQMKTGISEKDILKDVIKIAGDCDLRNTTVEDLSFLKKIGGTLTIDSASQLKNMSGLEEILGSVMVHAKDKQSAKEFLKSIGINLSAIKGNIIPVIKNYL